MNPPERCARPRNASRTAVVLLGLAWVAGLGAVAALGGCSKEPVLLGERYRGPALSVETTGDQHVVVADAPSPGWALHLVESQPKFKYRNVIVQLERPNPQFLYPDRTTVLRQATGVRSAEIINLYARVVEYGRADSDAPYTLVRGSASTPTPAAQPATEPSN